MPGFTLRLPPNTVRAVEWPHDNPPRAGARPRAVAALIWASAAGLVLTLAWLSYSRNGWVPFLSGVDLGVHEFGHLVFAWAPSLWMSLAGSAVQVAAPLVIAGYFWWRRDRFAVVLLVAWTGMSLNNVAVYAGDAQRMVLPLFGDDGSGAGHDWRNILGELGLLQHTDTIAGLIRALSVVAFAGALLLVAWSARSDLRPGSQLAPKHSRSWVTLPVRNVPRSAPEAARDRPNPANDRPDSAIYGRIGPGHM